MSASPWHAIRKVPVEQLRGKTLRFLVPSLEPPYVNYINFTPSAVKDHGYNPGVVVEIMKDIGKTLNLTYELVVTNDTKWGNLVNGTWNGAFGRLYKGEADMIAGATIMQYDRSLISDLTYPFEFELTGMLIRTPIRYSDHTFLIVTQPFKWEVWGLTAIAILASGIVLKLLTRVLGSLGEHQYSPFDSVWIFFSIFVQQGLPHQPSSWTCRILLALWWLAAMTLMATFTGSLVALFAVQRINLPFTSVEGMLRSIKAGHYIMLMDVNSQTRTEMIAESNISLFKELWHEMSVNKRVKYVDGLQRGVDMVKASEGGLVLVGSMVTLEYYAFVDCQLTLIPEGFLPTYLSIPLLKNSPFSTYFSSRIQELNERGFIQKWMRDYLVYLASRRTTKCNETMTETGNLSLRRAQGAFWLLLAGLSLAFLFLFVEYIYSWLKARMFKSSPRSLQSMSTDNISTLKSSKSFGAPTRESMSTSSDTEGSFSRGRNALNLSLPLRSLPSMKSEDLKLDDHQSPLDHSLEIFEERF
ncbi:unnamed protein product, partial [Mesorhabditis belari]|uniref:Uncharacterized protein n=1 Tax=Mesorhabditis belari TaxID=2138241 RepID=A0AAF3FLC9_9BILA